MSTYPDSVAFLYSLGNEIKAFKFGLETIRLLSADLGNPQLAFPTIHVAGTNGKGSVCAMLESCLHTAGHRTGLYTSPHLTDPTERIRINGVAVTTGAFTEAFNLVHQAAETLIARDLLAAHPTYFETITAMGFALFAAAAVEIGVVEVGLGGRLDATNIVQPELCVLTSIDYDHEQWLGSTLEQIAGEKAGILKPGVAAVSAPQRPEVADVFARKADDLGVDLHFADERAVTNVQLTPFGSTFQLNGTEYRCPLAGAHQVTNAVVAITALQRLELPGEAIADGLQRTVWPGRLEHVRESPEVLLDGAHNPAGARALASYLRQFHTGRRPVHLIFGAMRDKSVEEVATMLFECATTVTLTAPDSPRALRPEALASLVSHGELRMVNDPRQAVDSALNQAAPGDLIVVTGSLYLVGEVRPFFV